METEKKFIQIYDLKLKELLQEKSQHGDKYDYKDQRACKKFNILYNIRVEISFVISLWQYFILI